MGSIRLRDTYCENALSKEIAYLLSLDIGRFLAGFYENAGIRTPYARYGGWENTLIAGHTPGHYLSALAQACQNAGVCEEDKKRLFEKLTRMVDGLLECGARREGFLWAAPAVRGGAEAQFDNVEQCARSGCGKSSRRMDRPPCSFMGRRDGGARPRRGIRRHERLPL